MASAPAPVDTYRKYKKGTESFVQWLSGAARSTGIVDDVFGSGPLPQQATGCGRLKGKARIEAKKSGTLTKSSVYEVPINAFVRLAKAIVGKPTIEIPRSVLTTLGAVIRGRKDCATWYLLNQNDADEGTKRNNSSHQYFIKVLEDTLEVLGSKSRLPSTEKALVSDSTTTIKMTNMFAALEVEETHELEDIPDFVPSTKTESHVRYRLEPSDTDMSFAVYCFLRDLTRIRLFVRRTWREYKCGTTGLMAAALTMNTAIAMIEKLSKDFQEAHPRFRETGTKLMHEEIICFVYDGYCNKQEGPSFGEVKDDEADPLVYKEDGQILRSSTVMCVHTAELIMRHFFAREQLRLSTDERRLLKSISQLTALPVGKQILEQHFKGEKVHEAISEIVYDKKFETWAIFAVQIFWDTQRELGPMLPTAERLLVGVGQDLAQSWKKYLDTAGLDQVGLTHKFNREVFERRLERLRTTVLGSELQGCIDRTEHAVWKVDLPAFSLLQNHPSMCGLILLSIRDEHHRVAMNIAGAQGQITVAAHLYNAARRSGLLLEDAHWTDMDHILEKQGSDWVFVGKRPEEGLEFVRHLKSALGFSITHWAKDYREPKNIRKHDYETVVGKVRYFEYLARYSELSYVRVNSRFKKPTGNKSCAGKDTLVMADTLAKDVLGIKNGSATLSTIDTLSAVKKAAEKDDDAFSFDVMAFYLRCLELLRSIRTLCMVEAPLDFPASNFTTGLSMNTAILDMFQHCIGTPHYQRPMFPDAVKILHDVIVKEGSMDLDKAKIRQQAMKVQQTILQSKIEPSFENPDEDNFPMEWRNLAGAIIFQDANGDIRMPFGER